MAAYGAALPHHRLAWALAHSPNKADVTLAIRMLLDRDFHLGLTPGREYFYTLAVAHYRAADYLQVRTGWH